MPSLEVIKASEAPEPPKKMSKMAERMVTALNELKRDEVLRLTPDPGKSLRGLKTGVGRITKGNSLKVSTWDDGEALYVKKD